MWHLPPRGAPRGRDAVLKIIDPYGNLQARHDDAVRQAMQSDAAAYIRYQIADHLVEVQQSDDLEQPFTRGYRMGLRVAFLAAGGQVDGSEDQWNALEVPRG